MQFIDALHIIDSKEAKTRIDRPFINAQTIFKSILFEFGYIIPIITPKTNHNRIVSNQFSNHQFVLIIVFFINCFSRWCGATRLRKMQ